MIRSYRNYSGFGELLCVALAWTVGLAGLWSEYTERTQKSSGNKVAVTQADRGPSGYFD
jgi:hypothetical protein